MKKLWDLAQENLVNIQGSYGILDQYLWMSAIPWTWPSKCKSAQKQYILLCPVLIVPTFAKSKTMLNKEEKIPDNWLKAWNPALLRPNSLRIRQLKHNWRTDSVTVSKYLTPWAYRFSLSGSSGSSSPCQMARALLLIWRNRFLPW